MIGTALAGRLAGGRPAGAVARVLREPVSRRARRELLFCLAAAPLSVGLLAVPAGLLGVVRLVALTGEGRSGGAERPLAVLGGVVGLLAALVLATAAATLLGRGLGTAHRRLAARLLDEPIAAPPPPGRSALGRLGAAPRDAAGWRAVGYLLLKLPLAVLQGYALLCWVTGLVDLSYPFWWGLFRNHAPGTHLSPVPVLTPFPGRVFHIATFPGTFLAFAMGAGTLLVAPWVTRAVVSLDRAAMRHLLGPGRLAQRVHDLERSRALAVDDAAATLRRLERDLHDGAQIRLATLAMNLGRVREKLGANGEPPDLGQARELVAAAHSSAKDALAELRDLVRGIHPPALDNGLPDALATLCASGAVPVDLVAEIPERPTPAIETIAYFCAAELLANAAKHSRAGRVRVEAVERGGRLCLAVSDDGTGGAAPVPGGGLAGLSQRISTVDGRLSITSPPGGPTRVSVDLPLRA